MTSRRAPMTSAATRRSALSPQALRRQAPQAFVPGPKPRKEQKPGDAGAKSEHQTVRLVNKDKHQAAWRRPGVRGQRNTGDGFILDSAGYMPDLEPYVAAATPTMGKNRPTYNYVMSIKSQHTPGSAKQKIPTEVEDLAGLCDVLRIVGVVVLDTTVLTPAEIAAHKKRGADHLVAVLTRDEIKARPTVVRDELVRIAKARLRLARRIGPRGGITLSKTPTNAEMAYKLRTGVRRAARAKLVTR